MQGCTTKLIIGFGLKELIHKKCKFKNRCVRRTVNFVDPCMFIE